MMQRTGVDVSRRGRVVFVLIVALLIFGGIRQSQAQTDQADEATTGRSLFEGAVRFDNGGPPCLACHSVAGIGALGGGTLGPDLTGAYEKFGEDGIAAIVATTPFPTMNPIFSERPLTVDEQDAVASFLESVAVTERGAAGVTQLALLGVGGAVVLLLLARFYWSRRVTAVRRPMLARARASIQGMPGKPTRREPQTLETGGR